MREHKPTFLDPTALTDAAGRFHIPHLIPGQYKVKVAREGFQDYENQAVQIPEAGNPTELVIELERTPERNLCPIKSQVGELHSCMVQRFQGAQKFPLRATERDSLAGGDKGSPTRAMADPQGKVGKITERNPL